MSTVDEALKDFRSSGEVQEVKRKFKEIPSINLKEKKGVFARCTITEIRDVEFKVYNTIKTFVKAILIETNATAKIKTGKGDDNKNIYVPADPVKGDEVSFEAPTRLARLLKEVALGTEVFIEFLGKSTEIEKGRGVTANRYVVRAKKTELPF